MGRTMRKLDLIALSASGEAAKKLRDLLEGLREDIVSALAQDDLYHKTVIDGCLITVADATNYATAKVLANAIKPLMNTHLASTGQLGVHRAASAAEITSPDATTDASARTLVHELKDDFNTHLIEAGTHVVNDATNTVVSADPSNEGETVACVNEVKLNYNAHVVVSLSSMTVEA